MQVPGRVLEPGSYVFKLLDSDAQRTIVEIYTADHMQLLTMVMAISAYRLDPPDKTIITFSERPGGAPEALHHWFYPGETNGIEFIYPKSERQFEVAAAPAPAATPAAEPVSLPAPPQVETADRAEEPEPPVIIDAQEATVVEAPEAPAPVAATDTPPETLPQTSSNIAILPFAGLALLFSGLAALRFAAARG